MNTIDFGFSVLPAGFWSHKIGYVILDRRLVSFWNSTELDSVKASSVDMHRQNDDVSVYNTSKDFGFSVRCIKD